MKICPESVHFPSTPLLPLGSKPPSALPWVSAVVSHLVWSAFYPYPLAWGFNSAAMMFLLKLILNLGAILPLRHLAVAGDISGHHSRRELLLASAKQPATILQGTREQLFGPKLSPPRLRNPMLKLSHQVNSLLTKPPRVPPFTKTQEPGGLYGQAACQL